VIVPKIMGQEKVPVRIVIQGRKGKFVEGTPTLGHHGVDLGALYGEYGRDTGLTELQLGLYPNKAQDPTDQGTVQGHVDVPDLDLSKDIIFRGGIFQLDQVLEIKGGLRIVICRDLQPFPYLSQ